MWHSACDFARQWPAHRGLQTHALRYTHTHTHRERERERERGVLCVGNDACRVSAWWQLQSPDVRYQCRRHSEFDNRLHNDQRSSSAHSHRPTGQPMTRGGFKTESLLGHITRKASLLPSPPSPPLPSLFPPFPFLRSRPPQIQLGGLGERPAPAEIEFGAF